MGQALETSIGPSVAIWADSSGRRNTVFVGRQNQLIKRLCRRLPIEGLAGPRVEGSRHSGNSLRIVHAEIGTFWEILAQQPVSVLVGATLPRAVGIAEVDLDARVDF